MRRALIAYLACLVLMFATADAQPPAPGDDKPAARGGEAGRPKDKPADDPPGADRPRGKDGSGGKAGAGTSGDAAGGEKGAGKGAPARKNGAGDESSGKDAGKGRGKKPARNLAVAALRMNIENAAFEETTFEEFIEWLERTTQANVVVRWKLLEDEGVERDCPIELKRKDIPLRDLLPLVFAQVTEKLPEVELAARADGNTLMITTRQDIQTKNIVRVYDVQDLLAVAPNFRGMQVDLSGGARSTVRDTGRAGGAQGDDDPREKLDPLVKKLIDAITTHVQPLSWKVNGGKGTIRYFKGRLVVNNNIEVHQLLGGMISANRD